MKAKGLLLTTAALSLAAIFHSQAQSVYSVNVVGYVQQYCPPNGWNIISVPLNGTNNNLNTTLRLPDGFSDTLIYRFDLPTQNYRDTIAWFEGFGWFSPSDPEPTVHPGEGFWIFNPTTNRLNITFQGEAPLGRFSNVIPGGNNFKLLASIIPKPIKQSEIPAAADDTIYIWDPVTQNYKDPSVYFPGFGWFSPNPDDPGPDGYTIQPATGFWYQGTGGGIWDQTFSVN